MKNLHLLKPGLLAAACIAFFVAGCSTGPNVQTEYDPTANFTDARTFYVLPLPERIEGVDPGTLLRVGPAARNAVEAAMYELGYTQSSDVASADIAVYVHGRSVPKTDITDWGFTPYAGAYGWGGRYPYGWGAYGGSNITVDQYNEGTLIVEVYDVESEKMIWVGWITGRTTTDRSQQAGRVADGIIKILSNFPAAGMGLAAPES